MNERFQSQQRRRISYYHLPGLFEFYELYREFLPIFRTHREYFYDWCEIGSIYGTPEDACGVEDVWKQEKKIHEKF